MGTRVKIILHGQLNKLYSDVFEIEASTAIEAINGFARQTKAFETTSLNVEDRTCITVLGFDTRESLYELIPEGITELHLIPAMCGGKSGGFFKIILGAVIIAAAVWLGPAAGSLSAAFEMGGAWGFAFNMGVSLLLGGLLEMISPAPKIDTSGNSNADPEASKYIGGTQNSVKIGTRIPLLYGKHIGYGHYLSYDIKAVDVDV